MSREPVRFYPGPSQVRPEVLQALTRTPVPHRSPEFEQVVDRVQRRLRALLHTESAVFPVLGSCTTTLEAAMRCLARKRALVVVNGAFSQRLAAIAKSLGLEVETLVVPNGEPVEPELVERALAAGSFDTVGFVHNATSTGVISDAVAVAKVVRRFPGVALVLDAVSSIGGVDLAFDDLGPDAVLVTSTSKALACVPGGAILAVGPGARERVKDAPNAGYALSLERLLASQDKGSTPNTPNTPLLYALDEQLAHVERETPAGRAARHAAMAGKVVAWAEEHMGVLAREGARSPTITAVENTRGLSVTELRSELHRRGYEIAAGYGVLKEATFRIGHMGDLTPEQTDGLLAALDEVVAALD